LLFPVCAAPLLSKNVYKKFYKERNVCVQVLFTNIYVISLIMVAGDRYIASTRTAEKTASNSSFIPAAPYSCIFTRTIYKNVLRFVLFPILKKR
jgi:hypothetical protein